MDEHLFKLKKDGKTVGYLKIDKMHVLLNPIHRPGYWCTYDSNLCRGLFDTALPFVTKDKNSKDVFEGDYVSHDNSEFVHRVTWNKNRLEYVLLHPSSGPTWSLGFGKDREQKDIELIEEEK